MEGALYAAGLLTAWLHPDRALTDQALHDKVGDAYLRPLPPRSGRPDAPWPTYWSSKISSSSPPRPYRLSWRPSP
ncbi:hypothetical protein ACFQ60_03250 [Streptomyces zhihengii]